MPAAPASSRPPSATIAIPRAASMMLPLLISAFIYFPIVNNYFLMDDFHHMYSVANHGALWFVLSPEAGHVALIRNVVFYAFYRTFGLAAQPYFVSVLVTHLANVYLLWRLIQRLTRSPALACFGATLWGISPVNEGSLGYYSVYGHVVVATILLWVLNDLAQVADGTRPLSRRRLASWYGLLLVSTTCYGAGAAIAMVFAGVAFLLLPKPAGRTRAVAVLGSLVIVVPALVASVHWIHLKISGDLGYSDVFLSAQLRNWGPVPEMFGRLLAFATSGLAFPYPCAPSPAGRALCYVFPEMCAGLLLGLLVYGSPAARRWGLALMLVTAGSYASMAAGRALLLQALGRTSEWAATQPRYHYVGPAVIAVILCLLLHEVSQWRPFRSGRLELLLLVWLAAALIAHFTAAMPIDHHTRARKETQSVLASIDFALRVTPKGEAVYIANRYFASARDWRGILAAFPGWAGVFTIAHPENTIAGKRVYFVEGNPGVLADARAHPNSRIATLVVASDRLPQGVHIF